MSQPPGWKIKAYFKIICFSIIPTSPPRFQRLPHQPQRRMMIIPLNGGTVGITWDTMETLGDSA